MVYGVIKKEPRNHIDDYGDYIFLKKFIYFRTTPWHFETFLSKERLTDLQSLLSDMAIAILGMPAQDEASLQDVFRLENKEL